MLKSCRNQPQSEGKINLYCAWSKVEIGAPVLGPGVIPRSLLPPRTRDRDSAARSPSQSPDRAPSPPEGISGDQGIPKKEFQPFQCRPIPFPQDAGDEPPAPSLLPGQAPGAARGGFTEFIRSHALGGVPWRQNGKTQCVQSHGRGWSAGRTQKYQLVRRQSLNAPALCTAKCQLEYSQHSNVLQGVAEEKFP